MNTAERIKTIKEGGRVFRFRHELDAQGGRGKFSIYELTRLGGWKKCFGPADEEACKDEMQKLFYENPANRIDH
jgi:hypothetical protein